MVTIGTLNGGNITITTGGSAPAARTATRVWYGDDENVYTDYEIVGTISNTVDEFSPTNQIANVSSAKKIEIGSTVTSLGAWAFYDCRDLTSVTIPDSVTSIGNEAFGTTSISTIEFGRGIDFINAYAFDDINSLKSIVIPDTVSTIETNAFHYCYNIQTITIFSNGGNAESVKTKLIDPPNITEENITWNMPS